MKLKELVLLTSHVLHSLVKFAGEGTVDVHVPMNLKFNDLVTQSDSNFNIVGSGVNVSIYQVTVNGKNVALKILVSPQEEQMNNFRREIALMR
jgi:hypothetical protein